MACVRIERAQNGYSVEMTDPKIEAANRKRSASGKLEMVWQNPNKEYVFQTFEAMSSFLEKNLDKALPKDDYDSSFDSMAEDDD